LKVDVSMYKDTTRVRRTLAATSPRNFEDYSMSIGRLFVMMIFLSAGLDAHGSRAERGLGGGATDARVVAGASSIASHGLVAMTASDEFPGAWVGTWSGEARILAGTGVRQTFWMELHIAPIPPAAVEEDGGTAAPAASEGTKANHATNADGSGQDGGASAQDAGAGKSAGDDAGGRSAQAPARYAWTIVYAPSKDAKEGRQERKYELVVVDPATGRFDIDEMNGITLPARLIGGTLWSVFTVQGTQLMSADRFENAGTPEARIVVEIVTMDASKPGTTGGVTTDAGAIPEVTTLIPGTVQRAVLQNRKQDHP
jgi:hypothetical protein